MTYLDDLELLRRLVAFDTTSSESNLPLADFLCDYLGRPEVRIRRNPSADGSKANLLLETGPETTGGTGLVLSGHMDTVPAGTGEWTSPPFELTEREGRLFARGACDMKGFLAVAANVFARAARRRLAHPLALLFTYDEEVGTLGSKRFVETWPEGDLLPSVAIIGEPTSLRPVRRHKGHLKLRLRLFGRSAHSGYPHLGENALEPAARAILALAELGRALREERPPGSEHFPDVPFVALNVARAIGGVAINVVPDSCTVDVGVRHLPGMDGGEIAARAGAAVRGALGETPFELDLLGESPPLEAGPAAIPGASRGTAPVATPGASSEGAPSGAELAALLAASSGRGEGHGVSFATDAGWLQRLGMECVLFGPGSIEVAHRPDEFVPAAELEQAAAALERAVERCCETRGG